MNIIRYAVLIFGILLISDTAFAAEYIIPRAAYSVYTEDLDLDGDIDIVVGHNYSSQSGWGGVSILENDGTGAFTFIDSIFLYSWQTNVYAKKVNNDEFPDIIGRHIRDSIQYMAILINNQGSYIPSYYSMDYGISAFTTGDIEGDNDIDIIVASHNGQFWGVLYNDGTGEFSEPEYHYVTGVYPTDIECGHLNNDAREDILVSGQEVRIYYSYPTGFDCYIVSDDPEMQVEIADMDNDGDNDIVGVSDIWDIIALTMYENMDDGTFYKHNYEIYEINAPYFTLSDLNNNNLPDVVCSGQYGVYILYNEGDFQLSEPQYFPTNTSGLSRPPFCADVDGNGYNDIITIRFASPGILTILYNDGTGNFMEEPQVGIDPQYPHVSEVTLSLYPNPFSISISIDFSIKKNGFVELKIYDIKGRLIRELINQRMEGGEHNVSWNGKDVNNRCCGSGIYIVKLKLNDVSKKAEKVILLK